VIDIFRTRLTDTNLVRTRGESGLSVTSAYEVLSRAALSASL
jgi:hypothetical protein